MELAVFIDRVVTVLIQGEDNKLDEVLLIRSFHDEREVLANCRIIF